MAKDAELDMLHDELEKAVGLALGAAELLRDFLRPREGAVPVPQAVVAAFVDAIDKAVVARNRFLARLREKEQAADAPVAVIGQFALTPELRAKLGFTAMEES